MTSQNHRDSFSEWGEWISGSLSPPSWAHRARLEGEHGPHLESIRRAGRARARGRAGAAGGGGEPLSGGCGAEEGPGRAPSPAPPSRSWFSSPALAWAATGEATQLT